MKISIVGILEKLLPNPLTMLAQLCASAILFFLLYKLAYKPVSKILEERSNSEQEKLNKAQELLDKAQKSNDEIEANEKAAQLKAEQIISKAETKAMNIVDLAKSEARSESEKIIMNANRQIDNERQKMLRDVQDEIIANVFTTIENKLEDHTGDKVDDNSVETFLKEVVKK